MIKHITDCAVLNNGYKMPWLGFGVFQIPDGKDVEQAVELALDAGYRHIDTAEMYRNETGVGNAIKASGVPREEIFITTKVANNRQGFEETFKAFDDSLKKIQVDYIDLYLIHRPCRGKYKDTWRALEKLYKDGYVRAIGVSNFMIRHLEDLMNDSNIIPAVNQVEYHPYLAEVDLHNFCKKHNIQFEAWSPLVRGEIFSDPILNTLAGKYNKTLAQVVLRWVIQNEVITIPKSTRKERIQENANIFDFTISASDMAIIDGLNRNYRIGPEMDDPKY